MGNDGIGTDEKQCPECAESVKCEARVCRYCGHEFGVRTYGLLRSTRSNISASALVLVLAFVGLVGYGVAKSVDDAAERSSEASEPIDIKEALGVEEDPCVEMAVSADELMACP